MIYPIEKKFVIGVASSALFDLSDSHQVFLDEGPERYKQYQEKNIDNMLNKGVAFPFIRRFLSINERFPDRQPVEVVLLSRNSPETGLRVFRSIEKYGLNITRAAFTTGKSPFEYIPAFNCALFLTANEEDVKQALHAKHPAGLVLPAGVKDDENDVELRVAFDFDGVIVDDEAERVFKQHGLKAFEEHETSRVNVPHREGVLAELAKNLAFMQKLEDQEIENNPQYERIIRVAVVTARGAPAHERVVTTLKDLDINVDETFFLGGMEKSRVLSIMKPHIFFDDQKRHLQSAAGNIPMVHVPIGVASER